jgi:hypothetical protein
VKASFKLDGARGLQDALERGGENIKARVSRACEQTARNVQREARAHAPHDKYDLWRAIQVSGKGLSWRVGLDNVTLTMRGGNSAHQNPSVYGVWYEYGFKTKDIDAVPYMKPAADSEEQAHVERTEAAINGALGGLD